MINSNGGMKLLLVYSIKPDRAQEYYDFMLGRYIPVMQTMGLEVSEAWHTAYGNYPNRLVAFISRDKSTINDVLENDIWEALTHQLLDFVTEFSFKVVPYKVGFQI